MNVSGLLFDMDDVLYDATMWHRWLLQLLGRLGLHTHYRAFFCVWEREFLSEVYCGRRDYWDALRDFLQSSGLSRGQIDEVLAAGHARRRELQDSIRPLPGVLATIAKLHGMCVPMGILCNASCAAERLQRMLHTLGLGDRFQTVVSSFDLGCAKPAPRAYSEALNSLGLPAEQVAFVGHCAVELSGAKRAGMATIAFNHDADAVADRYVQRFDELLTVLNLELARAVA